MKYHISYYQIIIYIYYVISHISYYQIIIYLYYVISIYININILKIVIDIQLPWQNSICIKLALALSPGEHREVDLKPGGAERSVSFDTRQEYVTWRSCGRGWSWWSNDSKVGTLANLDMGRLIGR